MKARVTVALLVALVLVTSANHLHGQKIKMIVDQDARGPATTDMQSILIFLQSDRFDVLGITTVSGDQWVKEETQRTLRLLEITGAPTFRLSKALSFLCLTPKKKANAGKRSMASSAIRAAGAIFPIGRRARLLDSGPSITSLM